MATPQLAPRQVIRYADSEAVATAAAERLLLTLGDLLARPERVRADIAVTGGGDGIHVLELMSTSPLLHSIDWQRVHIWWGDERFVPADSGDRNALQAREVLLDGLVSEGLLPGENIHEMRADTRSEQEREAASDAENQDATEASAVAYEAELRHQLGENPHLDIALFGMGPDGHFASLFPGHDEVRIDDGRLACGVINSPKPPPLRVSLTVPMIQASRHVWVIASGEAKHDAMSRALRVSNDPDVPISNAAGCESTVWMLSGEV